MNNNTISLSSKVAHNIIKNNKLKFKSKALAKLSQSPEDFLSLVKTYRLEDDFLNPLFPVSRKVRFEKKDIDGSILHYIRTKKKCSSIIFYLHGGSYIEGPNIIQWQNMINLASKTKSDVALFNYPKTPEMACSNILPIVKKAYIYAQENNAGMPLFLMGDSAGGGLCLSLFQLIKEQQLQVPDKIVLLSPWLDVSMSNPQICDYEETDLILSIEGLKACGKYYAGEQDLKDPLVSPMYGKYKNIPETHIFVGGSELFKPDCIEFSRSLEQQNENITLHYEEGMQHIWPFFPISKEAKKARKEIYRIFSK